MKVISTEEELQRLKLKSRDKVIKECRICHKVYQSRFMNKDFVCRECKILETKRKNGSLELSNDTKRKISEKLKSAESQSKRKTTSYERYGTESPSQTKEMQEKRKKTCIEKYGGVFTQSAQLAEKRKDTMNKRYGAQWVETEEGRAKLHEILSKEESIERRKQTVLEKYGVTSVKHLRDLNSYRKSLYTYMGHSFDSSYELCFWICHSDAGDDIKRECEPISYTYEDKEHKCFPDFCLNGEIVEIKGSQFRKEDGTWQSPYDHMYDQQTEAKRQALVEHNVRIVYTDSEEMRKCVEFVDRKYTSDFVPLFKNDLPFPFIEGDLSDIGLIQHFHKSIYWASKKGKPSPIQAWQDKELVRKTALNRLRYVGSCKPADIRQGFSVTRCAPKISVFRPKLAQELITEFLSKYDTIVDPFSGFSGRLLGAYNCNKTYIGKDINEDHVRESNEIISFKHMTKCSVIVENLLEKKDTEQYDCLFTCPPYGGKEHWNENNDEVELSCDEWIKLCMQHYKCKIYLFVVDETDAYKNHIVRSLTPKQGLFKKMNEYVVLIENLLA